MPFISGGDRRQVMFAALDDMVAPDSEARVIDAFVGSLDLDAMGFARVEPAERGRPAFEPADLLKLYVYGYRNGIRSSRSRPSAGCSRQLPTRDTPIPPTWPRASTAA